MKRALSAVVMLLFLLPAPGGAGADPAVERWSADRLLADNLTLPAGTDLAVGPGLNVTFSPRPDGAGPAVVVLELGGGLEVCGTTDRPVSFIGPDPSAAPAGGWAASLSVEGDGLPDQLAVRNCTFRDITVDLAGVRGGFSDCLFDNASAYVGDSAAYFLDCTFHDSELSVYNPETTNLTTVSGCRFEAADIPPGRNLMAILVSGYVDISACDISGYYTGIKSSSGLPTVRDCTVRDCFIGIDLETTDPADTPVIENCTVRDCQWVGASVSGNLLLRNSTLENSIDGLILSYATPDMPPSNWTLAGNRIINNSEYGIVLFGHDLDVRDTLFDDGAGTANLRGMVLKKDGFSLVVVSPAGNPVYYYNLTLTDATGNVTREDEVHGYPSTDTLTDYLMDNSGGRVDFYPYNITVESMGVSNSTVLRAPGAEVTLVLALLPDLVPAGLGLSPPSPRAGDYVSFSFRANNSGVTSSGITTALFLLDGQELDVSQMFPQAPGSSSPVRSVEWKAVGGAHRIEVRLDPNDLVQENDETNNNLSLDFTVRPAPAAPAGVSYIQFVGAGALMIAAFAVGIWAARRRRGRREGA